MKQITNLNIIAKRWFQKTYGNTYHSVKIYVNDEILVEPFAYGYYDYFFQTAQAMIEQAGYDLKLGDSRQLDSRHLREVLGGTYEVIDVNRKKDL